MNARQLAAGLFFLLAPAASAQVGEIFDPLDLPRSTLVCQNLPTGVTGSEGPTFVIRMSEGKPYHFIRSLVAGYDSAGRARFLRIALEVKTKNDTSHIMAVTFAGDLAVKGARALATNMVDDGLATSDAEEEPRLIGPFISLSAEEANRALQLAEWMWRNRCEPRAAVVSPD